MKDYPELVEKRLRDEHKDNPLLKKALVLAKDAFDYEASGGKDGVMEVLIDRVQKITEGTDTELEAIEQLLQEV